MGATVYLIMGYLATWSLVMLGAGAVLALDLASIKNFPAGLDLRKIQNLMRIVDPKTCGCARPEQHCEVPVPEARFVGFTCKIGTFCCRMKKQPGRPNLKDFQRFIPTQPSQSPPQQFSRTRPPPRQVPSNNRDKIQKNENSWRKDTAVKKQPIYNHNEIKTEEIKEKVDEIEPHQLGLPKGIKAFIKPVSQLQHRILAAPAEEIKTEENDEKTCKCELTDSCPKEQRDYITFRKSCPFGQVQCCRKSGEIAEHDHSSLKKLNAEETGLKGEIEILSTTSKTYPAQIQPQTSTPIASLSHIRPVHIPIPLVPTTSEKGESTPPRAQTPEDQLTDQTFRKKDTVNIGTTTTTTTTILPTETTSSSPAVTTTPSSVTLLYSATPYTIISSSTSISKIEWDYQPNNQQKKVFQVHNLPSTNVKNTKTAAPPLVFSTRKPIFISPDRSQGNRIQQRRPIQQTQRPQRIQPTNQQFRPHVQNRPTKTSSVPRSQTGTFQVVNPSTPAEHPQRHLQSPAQGPEHIRPRQHNGRPSQGHPQINRPRPANIHPHSQNIRPQSENIRPHPQNIRPPSHNVQPQPHNIRPQSQNIRPPSQNIHPQPQNNEQNIWQTISNTDPQQFSNINQPRARPPTQPETLYPLEKNAPKALPPRQPLQPPIRQIIDRSDSTHPFQSRQMGFVESVGDAAIKMVEKLFSWPF